MIHNFPVCENCDDVTITRKLDTLSLANRQMIRIMDDVERNVALRLAQIEKRLDSTNARLDEVKKLVDLLDELMDLMK